MCEIPDTGVAPLPPLVLEPHTGRRAAPLGPGSKVDLVSTPLGPTDQGCRLHLVGHDLGHPQELDRGPEEDGASDFSSRCHQVCVWGQQLGLRGSGCSMGDPGQWLHLWASVSPSPRSLGKLLVAPRALPRVTVYPCFRAEGPCLSLCWEPGGSVLWK